MKHSKEFFINIFKHFEVALKKTGLHLVFQPTSWITDETLFLLFDILHDTDPMNGIFLTLCHSL